jgi:hypothetical protein
MDIFIVDPTCGKLPRIHHGHPAPERTLSKSNPLMPILHRCGYRTLLLLLLAEIITIICTLPATAGQLLDVRIGEYDDFTRVVFEVDTPSAHPRIEIRPEGQLAVAFDHTEVNLVRKIPVERSRHIKTIQFWHHDGHLSTILRVDYPHYRFETFSLGNPPRVAVDIFPVLTPSASASKKTLTAAESPPTEARSQVPVEKSVPLNISEPGATEPVLPNEQPTLQSEEETQPPPSAPPLEAARTESPKLRPSDPKKDSTVPLKQYNRQTAFRLQFFLVIGLVVITIGILCLLLMMLFARHRFSKVKSKLSASEFLRQQDEKIDDLNARIQEQFERYDKA